jgi:hypothetical protein
MVAGDLSVHLFLLSSFPFSSILYPLFLYSSIHIIEYLLRVGGESSTMLRDYEDELYMVSNCKELTKHQWTQNCNTMV